MKNGERNVIQLMDGVYKVNNKNDATFSGRKTSRNSLLSLHKYHEANIVSDILTCYYLCG